MRNTRHTSRFKNALRRLFGFTKHPVKFDVKYNKKTGHLKIIANSESKIKKAFITIDGERYTKRSDDIKTAGVSPKKYHKLHFVQVDCLIFHYGFEKMTAVLEVAKTNGFDPVKFLARYDAEHWNKVNTQYWMMVISNRKLVDRF